MKLFALLVMRSAWACVFRSPRSTASNLLQILGFGVVGAPFSWLADSRGGGTRACAPLDAAHSCPCAAC